MKKLMCLIMVVSMVSVASAALVARYEFEGNYNDSTGTFNGTPTFDPASVANPATETSGIWYDAGGNGKAAGNVLYLGYGQAVLSGAAHPLNNFSYAVWVKTQYAAPVGIMDNQIISQSVALTIAPAGTYGNVVASEGDFMGFVWQGGSGSWVKSTGVNGEDQQWHHVVHTVGGGFQRLYVDGVLNGEVAATGQGTAGARLDMGWGIWGHPGISFTDDAQVYNHVLSASEVAVIYAGGVIPEPATMLLLGLGGLALIRRKS